MPEIVIYTRFMCGYCDAAKRLLKAKGLTFTERDVTFDPALRQEMMERSDGASTLPQILIGGRHVGGCDDLFELEADGELDALLAEPAEKSA